MADLTIRQGDTSPAFTATLTEASGVPIDLTGASVSFIMRSLTNPKPTVTAAATVVDATSGAVSYTFSTADTAVAGQYMAECRVTFGSGSTLTCPVGGWFEIEVSESLSAPGGQSIVSLGEVKDWLGIRSSDRTHDDKLLSLLYAVTPVVEHYTGPVILRTVEEWHTGGQWWVELLEQPVNQLLAVSEYLGPVEYPLNIVQDPAHGQIYSVMFEPPGYVVRRTTGGGVRAFPQMPQAVHVFYEAGRSSVPTNIAMGTKELIRVNYQQTQQQNRIGSYDPDDSEPGVQMLGFFVPGRVRELLQPSKNAPGVW